MTKINDVCIWLMYVKASSKAKKSQKPVKITPPKKTNYMLLSTKTFKNINYTC